MGGRRISQEELQKIETLIIEGSTYREIAEQLGRSEAGIRNIRYRKGLINKAEDESKALFQQRDQLRNAIGNLTVQKNILTQQVTDLRKEKGKLEASINTDKTIFQNVLAQALMNLKQQRPDLFVLTGQDQMLTFFRIFLELLTKT